MEFCGSRTLCDYIHEQQDKSENTILAAFNQLVEGVVALHEASIFHRDLKTSNVRVTAKGQIKIVDFGLATTSAESQDRFCGTVYYLCPQMALKQKYTPSCVDVWCLGVILYRLSQD